MSEIFKQECVDLMGDHLFMMFLEANNDNRLNDCEAIHSEWVVDGCDPEDGEYEFMFINDLTEV